jgi:fumarylacetoacetate (FAA) hydrolase
VIRRVMMVNDVSVRNLIPAELANGFGFFHGKLSTAFSPEAVTFDELGAAWQDGKLQLALANSDQWRDVGAAQCWSRHDVLLSPVHRARGEDPAPRRRRNRSGTVSNKLNGGPGKPVNQGGAGYTYLAEARTIETILEGEAKTPYLKFLVRFEMLHGKSESIFGAIDQKVLIYKRS